MHEVVFTLAAEIEWFDLVQSHGDRFEIPLDRTLTLLRANPEMGIEIRVKPLRRILISKTSRGLFYGLSGNRIVIASILDVRRDPQSIEDRLRQLRP